jgi:hypothetical protein
MVMAADAGVGLATVTPRVAPAVATNATTSRLIREVMTHSPIRYKGVPAA